MKREGVLFVISAPSGAGKTSLCKEIIDIIPNLRHSVSYTTRTPRPGELHGRDYFFVDQAEFQRMIEAQEFAEWAEVHGNLYGTSLATLNECRANGIDLILDIDCQGAQQLKGRYNGGVYIFILPPSIAELRRRLDNRSSDSEEVIERRIRNAAGEIREARWYDYIIVNDVFAVAVEQLKAVLTAEQCRSSRVIQGLSENFDL
ncbi:guanylate kinase [Geomesophilobacter sediminis]|uniref:Guanylate kinase n=1 Tax=Geomesophilobacter sediminis TaxID=2798584 RepID=A0A8J7S8K0_9BACT|nr:guanylate kinase [Geomesophilobacter sediminis]MBJ6727706.1 guanylate kinase [Geomesophilobacter sediminis]